MLMMAIVMQNNTNSEDRKAMGGEMNTQLDVTIATRFDRETAGVLRIVAREKGIGVTTLIRMWTLDRLRRLNKTSKYNGAVVTTSSPSRNAKVSKRIKG